MVWAFCHRADTPRTGGVSVQFTADGDVPVLEPRARTTPATRMTGRRGTLGQSHADPPARSQTGPGGRAHPESASTSPACPCGSNLVDVAVPPRPRRGWPACIPAAWARPANTRTTPARARTGNPYRPVSGWQGSSCTSTMRRAVPNTMPACRSSVAATTTLAPSSASMRSYRCPARPITSTCPALTRHYPCRGTSGAASGRARKPRGRRAKTVDASHDAARCPSASR